MKGWREERIQIQWQKEGKNEGKEVSSEEEMRREEGRNEYRWMEERQKKQEGNKGNAQHNPPRLRI